MKFARFIDNTAVEIFITPDGFGISDCFHPTVAGQFESVADDVDVGYTKPVVEAPVVETPVETPTETPPV
jgi:hypothetical protein